jgi:hypothetical protein
VGATGPAALLSISEGSVRAQYQRGLSISLGSVSARAQYQRGLSISEGSVRWEPPRVESSLMHSRIKASAPPPSAPCPHRLCLHRDPVGDLRECSARMHATMSVTSHRVPIGDVCAVTRVGGLCKLSKSRRRHRCDGGISAPFC